MLPGERLLPNQLLTVSPAMSCFFCNSQGMLLQKWKPMNEISFGVTLQPKKKFTSLNEMIL